MLKVLSAAFLSAFVVSAMPLAALAGAGAVPTTKAECLKHKDMMWNAKTNHCVKK